MKRLFIGVTIFMFLLSIFIVPALSYGAVDSKQISQNNQSPAAQHQYTMNDCHLHYVNFVQETNGMDLLIKEMDKLGVEQSMLTGLPVVKKWDINSPVRPIYYLDDDARSYYYTATDVIVANAVLSLPQEQKRRFHPYICGFNPTDRNAVDHVKRMLELYPGFWEGIGEILLRHDDLTALMEGEQARADHIALDPVYDLACEQDFPVLLHTDIGSAGNTDPIYLPELENALKKHPKTRFIWAHAGIGRRINIPALVKVCDRLLSTYDNLWIDLTSHLYEEYLVVDGRLSQDWVNLVEKYPDRFMIGSDVVGHFDTGYEDHITRNYILLDALKGETVEKVAKKNFISILPLRVREKM